MTSYGTRHARFRSIGCGQYLYSRTLRSIEIDGVGAGTESSNRAQVGVVREHLSSERFEPCDDADAMFWSLRDEFGFTETLARLVADDTNLVVGHVRRSEGTNESRGLEARRQDEDAGP